MSTAIISRRLTGRVARQSAREQSKNSQRVIAQRTVVSTTIIHPVNGLNTSARHRDLRFLLGLGITSCAIVKMANEDECWARVSSAQSATSCSAMRSGDVLMLEPHKEISTGILFPHLCNAMTFVGCGVRVKYGFVKVYAVGTYMDPVAMSAVKTQGPEAIAKTLLNPSYPRTIRIVMNRGLSIEKYTAAIVDALSPRMKGEDMDKLEEFKKLNPSVDLIEGAEMEMTIRGNTMLYKNSVGGVGQIESAVFCRALCDVYYGADPVSPGHKDEVTKGVQKL